MKKFLLPFILGFFFLPLTVSAQGKALEGALGGLKNTANKSGVEVSERTPTDVVAGIVNVVAGLLSAIAVLLIVYAAALWITARGEAAPVQKAKDIIRNAVVGLVVLGLAYGITQFIISLVIG